MNMPTLKPLALSLLLLAGTPAWAANTWKINLKDADISALVTEMAEITGKNFVVDPRVKGTVTVVSSRAMTAGELYELFESVLSINGFAAVKSGPVVKILPDTNARQAGVRVDLGGRADGEQIVTRVLVLRQASANELLAALRPMMPQFAHMAAVPGANALVISDRASNADAMEAIVRELDGGEQDDAIEIIPVRNGRAADLISVLENMESGAAGPGKDGKPIGKIRVIADERTNRLLVRGDRILRDRVRAVIRNLDDAPDSSAEIVKVFRLKFASARQVAEVLKGVLASGDDKVSTSTASAPVTNLSSAASDGGSSGSRQTGTTTITIGSSSLIADETQNALIVRAKPAQIRQVESVLNDLDTRRAQVLIQAAIVEVSGDNAAQLGVQWAAGDPSAGVGLINFNNAGASIVDIAAAAVTGDVSAAGIGQGAAIGFGSSKKDAKGNRTFYGALIQALNTVTDANLLSTPSILTLDNQEAKIVVGQNVPFITGSTGTSGSGVTNPFTTIQRQDVGITLKVTPSLSDGGTVRLDVEQEVSSVVPSVDGIKSSDIITNKRSIKTSILADDGQTIVLGGLVQDDVKKSVSKVPFLGDIPGVGVLFRSTSDTRIKRNLLVFLQPTILRDPATASALTQKQYASVRSIDLGLDAEGRLTRLPANIQEIYQGGKQRDGVQARPQAQPAATPQPAPAAAPQTFAPASAAPALSVDVAPAPASDSEPQVYAASVAEPIQAESVPAPAQLAPAPARSVPQPVAMTPSYAPPPQPAPAASYVPPTVSPASRARPFMPTEPEPLSPYFFPPASAAAAAPAAPAPTPAPAVEATAPAAPTSTSGFHPTPKPYQPDPALQRELATRSPAAATQPAAGGSSGRRMIRTKSGNVYYAPEEPRPLPAEPASDATTQDVP